MDTIQPDQIEVRDNPAESRFEARVQGRLAMITYQKSGGRIVFLHTETPPELEGHGIAGRMAQVALDSARAQGLGVIPMCPYVHAYIKRHPAYADLIPEAERAQFMA